MIFRAIDSDGDWTFGRGLQSYLRGASAIEANLRTRLYSFLNDCFFAQEEGVDWWNLIGSKNRAGIILQCRKVLVQSFGVVRINKVDAYYDANSRKFTVSYNIDTIYSRNIQGSIPIA